MTVSVLGSSSSVYGVDVSDIQSNVTLEGKKFTGTSKFLSGSNAITDVWGEGNFVAVTFTADNWNAYDSVKVGLEPSQGSGAAELIGHLDDLDSVFKVGNPITQKLKIVASKAGKPSKTQVFDLSGLTLEEAGEG